MQTHDRGDRVFPLDGLVPAFRRNINTFQDDGIGLPFLPRPVLTSLPDWFLFIFARASSSSMLFSTCAS